MEEALDIPDGSPALLIVPVAAPSDGRRPFEAVDRLEIDPVLLEIGQILDIVPFVIHLSEGYTPAALGFLCPAS